MADEILALFDDFSGGDWGTVDSSMAPKASWSGSNVVVYRDGLIGPRPGAKGLSVTGLDDFEIGCPLVVTGLLNLPAKDTGTTKWRLYEANVETAGNAATDYDTGISYTGAGTVSVGVTWARPPIDTPVAWLENATGRFYYGSPLGSPPTVTMAGGAPGGPSLVWFGSRVWGGDFGTNKVYYSDVNDPETWPAANYVEIGMTTADYIRWMVAGRNALYVFMASSVYAITGTPGSSLTVRRVLDYSLGPTPNGIGMSRSGLIGLAAAQADSVPVLFSGAAVSVPANRRLNGEVRFSDSLYPGEWVMPAGEEGLVWVAKASATSDTLTLFDGKTWSHHSIARASGVQVGYTGTYGQAFAEAPVDQRSADFIYFVTHASGSAPTVSCLRVANFTNPGIQSSSDGTSPGDGSNTPLTASFSLPDIYSGDGSLLRVAKVVVHFRKYATGTSANAAFTVSLTPVGVDSSGDGSAETSTFSEAVPVSNTNDVYRTPGFSRTMEAEGFRLAFTGLASVAIRRVVVFGEKVPARP